MNFTLSEHTHWLARSLLNTELTGIRVDLDYATQLGDELITEIGGLTEQLEAACSAEMYDVCLDRHLEDLGKRKTMKGKAAQVFPEFKVTSPKMVGALLFEKLGLPGQKKFLTYEQRMREVEPNWNTSKEELEMIKHLHPAPALIRRERRMTNYLGTVIEGTLKRMVDGRVHPSFNVAQTDTGRISHSNPNMGNMPAKDPEWAKLRGIFLPDEGEQFFGLDYKQLEVCIEAHYTRDKNLLRIVMNGESKHDITNEAVGLGDRDKAKTLNFASQYFCGPNKIAAILQCSKAEAQTIYDRYWATYAGPKDLKRQTDKSVDQGVPIPIIYGRVRRFEKRKRQHWDKAYRQAYNAMIQGTGAELMNRAFYLADDIVRARGIGRMLWTVHDEAIGSALPKNQEECMAVLKEQMIGVGVEAELTVPLSVDGKMGLDRWEK